MKRKWPALMWAGIALLLAGLFTFPLFTNIPATRDYSWANFVLLTLAAVILVIATVSSFKNPAVFRGKILGSILSVLALAAVGLFSFGIFYAGSIPRAASAPNVGETFELAAIDPEGKSVTLPDLLSGDAKGALLIFYRGHW